MKRPPCTVDWALFQARMWREYARAFDGVPVRSRHAYTGRPIGLNAKWVASCLRVDRAECLRRARIRVQQARQIREGRGVVWFGFDGA